MYKALYLSPMLPSFNIGETVLFFTDILQFKIARDDKSYIIVYKDNRTVHILEAVKDIDQMEFYLEIDQVDRLWNSIKDKLKGIKVRRPFDREYGMREIHIAIPQTNALLFIGQSIK
ncbi:MAG: hypothetical protein ACXWWC_15030 [Chitinophagaceae bacterium]